MPLLLVAACGLFGLGFWLVYPGLLAILAVFWGLTTWVAWRLAALGRGVTPGVRATRVLIYLPILWVLVEWARTQGYFAFPWGTLGYAWLETPVAQLAAFAGVYGLSLLVVVPAAVLAWPWSRPGRPRASVVVTSLVVAAAFVGAAFWLGSTASSDAPPVPAEVSPPGASRALLVQGDVDPFSRTSSAAHDLNVHLMLTEDGVAAAAAAGQEPFDLVIWPEGAVLGYDLTKADAAPLRNAITASAPAATFILGGRAYEGVHNFNSLLALKQGAVVGRYDKHYLVPFGERWPLYETLNGVYAAVFRSFGLPLLASTSSGESVLPITTGGGLVGAYVCYESVFPQVPRELVARGAEVLVLGTNDAWFGLGTGGRQHFDMGRLRAIETRRWLLRAGNDGITAFIDPWGRVVERVERGVPATLAGTFETRNDLTFWVRHGQWLPAILAAALLAAVTLSWFVGRRAHQRR